MDILQLFFGRVSLHFGKFTRRDDSLWKEWVHRTGTSQILSSIELNVIEDEHIFLAIQLTTEGKKKTMQNLGLAKLQILYLFIIPQSKLTHA